jgi:hypothetical protein
LRTVRRRHASAGHVTLRRRISHLLALQAALLAVGAVIATGAKDLALYVDAHLEPWAIGIFVAETRRLGALTVRAPYDDTTRLLLLSTPLTDADLSRLPVVAVVQHALVRNTVALLAFLIGPLPRALETVPSTRR